MTDGNSALGSACLPVLFLLAVAAQNVVLSGSLIGEEGGGLVETLIGVHMVHQRFGI